MSEQPDDARSGLVASGVVPPGGVLDLVSAWCSARPFSVSDEGARRGSPEIPTKLATTLTLREPWRTQLLEDATLWLSVPQPVALGIEIDVWAAEPSTAFEGWSASMGPLEIRSEGRDRMDAWQAEPVVQFLRWQRVVLEDGEWKLAKLLDDRDRAGFEWLRDFWNWVDEGRKGEPPPPPPCAHPPRA